MRPCPCPTCRPAQSARHGMTRRPHQRASDPNSLPYPHTKCRWLLAVLLIVCFTTACHHTSHTPTGTAKTQPHPRNPADSTGSFAHPCTMYYLWSPRMALSAQHAATALSVAQQVGMRYRIHHPADISDAEISATLASLRPNYPRSAALLHLSTPLKPAQAAGHVFSHYPTAWLQRGRQVSSTITGVMPKPYWHRSLRQLHQSLQCA